MKTNTGFAGVQWGAPVGTSANPNKADMEEFTKIRDLEFPTKFVHEMDNFGGARAFGLFEAFCIYAFQGTKPKRGELDEEQTEYFNRVLMPEVDRQRERQRKRDERKAKRQKGKANGNFKF